MINDSNLAKPIFVQIADNIENEILKGNLKEGQKIPSQVDWAKIFGVNPLTVGKGVTLLESRGIVSKRRGLGMFVLDNAKKKICDYRRNEEMNGLIDALWTEVDAIGMSEEDLIELIKSRKK